MKKLALTLLLFAAPVVFPAAAQTLPPDPAIQRALTDAQVQQTLQQTQQNNAQLNFELQQQQLRQQQQFNTMPPPAYQQPAYGTPRPLTPGQP